MKDDVEEQRRVFRWALPGSVAAHLVVALLLIFGLPLPELATEEEKPIAVDLVPPEEPEKPREQPPPPVKQPEEPPEKKEETPPPTENDAARQAAPPALKPVFQFGEKDAGPRESREGNSAKEGSATPEAQPKPDQKDVAQPPVLTGSTPGNPASQSGAPETPAPKPDQTQKQEAPMPEEAKKLFSPKATGGVIATTAMGDLPRGVRAGRLCVTELREQLRNSLPPYFPDLLPSYKLDEGMVLDVPRAAFRMSGEWYELSYRCEVDTDATKVLSFAFIVGNLVPRSEWGRRGLPAR